MDHRSVVCLEPAIAFRQGVEAASSAPPLWAGTQLAALGNIARPSMTKSWCVRVNVHILKLLAGGWWIGGIGCSEDQRSEQGTPAHGTQLQDDLLGSVGYP